MPDLSPAALTIAKAILGPAFHPSKLTHPEPFIDAATALDAAGLLCPSARLAAGAGGAVAPAGWSNETNEAWGAPEAIDTERVADDAWWQACEQLWPELSTAGAAVSATIAHLMRTVYTQAAMDVNLDGAGALGALRRWLIDRGVPPSGATRIAADVVAIHAVVAAG